MRLRGILIGLSITAGLAAVGVAPAQADASGSLGSPGPGVLYDDCRDVPVPYSFALPANGGGWSINVTTVAPDGTSGPSRYLYSANPTSGNAALEFCGYEMPGTYLLTASGDYYDNTTDTRKPITFPTLSFTMRLPTTRTGLKKSVMGGQAKLQVTVTDERPAGYFGTEYAHVILQEKGKDGGWHNVPGTKGLTNSRGRYTKRVGKLGVRAQVRVVTRGASHYAGSTSKPVTLR